LAGPGAAAEADDPLLADLNPEQREAVVAPPAPLLVLAGAGSGKTRVLTRRLAYLIREGADPRRILAITFTNRAAREMVSRTEALLGPVASGMWVQTFHAACARILRREIGALGLGYTAGFSILDVDDQRQAMKEVLQELGLTDPDRHAPAKVLAVVSRAKQELRQPDDLRGEREDLARAWARYQERLRRANALDFDDLLVLTVRLVEEDLLREGQTVEGSPGARVRGLFDHVLVDEYQDTNHAQYRLVRALVWDHRSLTAVGDEDQSIYAFRGADITNILRFEEDFPEARVVRLERNYRSTQTILDAAGSVIAHNPRRYPKRLWTDQGRGERVALYEAADPQDEAQFVAREIARLRPAYAGWGDFAVLYRTHAQSRALEEALMARGIPYAVVGGLRFYERKEIKDALAYLRLLVNPYDWVSFRRAVTAPKRGVGDATLAALAEHLERSGASLPEALARPAEVPGVARAAHALEAFASLLAELRAAAEGGDGRPPLGVAEIVDQVLTRSGLLEEIDALPALEARTRRENLDELRALAREPGFGAGLEGVARLLERIALVSDADQVPDQGGAVLLMTLHAVKGLEYPVVFLVGLEEGVFPHARSADERGGVEEERRLCYVGMTRARQRLYLSYCRLRSLGGGPPRPARPSRFLGEVDRRLLAPVRRSAGGLGAALPPEPAPDRLPAPEGEEAFAAGDRVVHPRWGEGVVVSVRGRGPDGEVTVDFPSAGRRTLVVRYARLERV
jgi:DNA helicase-2/ATP-dependent DNA helicase PcrA